eukprot:4533254-Amphidinium_carterae.1
MEMRQNLEFQMQKMHESRNKTTCSITVVTKDDDDYEVVIKRCHYSDTSTLTAFLACVCQTQGRARKFTTFVSQTSVILELVNVSALAVPVNPVLQSVRLDSDSSQNQGSISAVSGSSTTHHSRCDSTQCSIQLCTQPKGDVRDQSEDQVCDQVCDCSHNEGIREGSDFTKGWFGKRGFSPVPTINR